MNQPDFLNYSELIYLLEMIHKLSGCGSIRKYKEVAQSFLEFAGADYMIFGFPESNPTGETPVRDLNINYPQEWVDIYQSNEFWRIDPVVKASLERRVPQRWADTYRRFLPDRRFLSLAHDFGLKDGFSCIERGRSGHHPMIISIAGDIKEHTKRTEYILEKITPHFRMAFLALTTKEEDTGIDNLTKRERETLRWLSEGKTSWEISMILNISENTVNFHIKNIKGKLNAVNRNQAVAAAMRFGLVH